MENIDNTTNDAAENLEPTPTPATESTIVGDLTAKAEELKAEATEKLGALSDQAEVLKDQATAKFEDLKEQATEKFEELSDKAEALKDQATAKLETLTADLGAKAEELKAQATAKLESIVGGDLGEKAEELREAATEKLTEAAEAAEQIVEETTQKAKGFFARLFGGK
ncbi:MAG: hypothetical protein V4683_13115 [Bacteroidota bacterium]